MQTVSMVITDSGDGSNGTQWVVDPKVLDRMEDLADEGDEAYSSGDGLQVKKLSFPDGFDVLEWLKMNNLSLTTMADMCCDEEE
jgi:hypothetical protein